MARDNFKYPGGGRIDEKRQCEENAAGRVRPAAPRIKPENQGRTTMGRVVLVLVLVVAVAAGAAWYAGWLNVTTANKSDGSEPSVTVGINKKEVDKDVEAAKKKAGEIKEEVKEKAGEIKEGVKETIQSVAGATLKGTAEDVSKDRITVKQADGKSVTADVTAETKVRTGDKDTTLADVKTGDTVTVACSVKDNKHTAKTITVEAKK